MQNKYINKLSNKYCLLCTADITGEPDIMDDPAIKKFFLEWEKDDPVINEEGRETLQQNFDKQDEEINKFISDEKLQQQNLKNRQAITNNYLNTRLNIRTIYQTNVQNQISQIIKNKAKGAITIIATINPNMTINYSIQNFTGKLTDQLHSQIIQSMNKYTPYIIQDLNKKMMRDNLYVASSIQMIIFNGNVG